VEYFNRYTGRFPARDVKVSRRKAPANELRRCHRPDVESRARFADPGKVMCGFQRVFAQRARANKHYIRRQRRTQKSTLTLFENRYDLPAKLAAVPNRPQFHVV